MVPDERSRARPRVSTVALVFFAVLMDVGVHRLQPRHAGSWRGTSASHTCPLPRPCSTATRRTPRSTIRSSRIRRDTSIRRNSLLRCVPLRTLPTGRRRAGRRRGSARAVVADAARARGAGRSLLCRRTSVGAVGERRASREHLDPACVRAAVAWRYRDRVWRPAWALGLAISAKLLMWPLLVWTVATRRLRVTAWAVGIGVAVTLAAWAVIGFAGLTGYPDLLRRLSEIQAERSYSIVGMAATAGLGGLAGQALTLLVGGGLLVACVVLARRGDDQRSFTCAVVATLALSPIVWLHYLVVLPWPLGDRAAALLADLARAGPASSPRPGYAEGVLTFFPGSQSPSWPSSSCLRPLLRRRRCFVVAPLCDRLAPAHRPISTEMARRPDDRGDTSVGGADGPGPRSRGLASGGWRRWFSLPLAVLTVVIPLHGRARCPTSVAIDFRQYYGAAEAILRGESPYLPTPGTPLTEWGGP